MKKITFSAVLLSSVCCLPLVSAMKADFDVKNGLGGVGSRILHQALEKAGAKGRVRNVIGISQDNVESRKKTSFDLVRDQFRIHPLIEKAKNIVKKRGEEIGYEQQLQTICAKEGPQLLQALLDVLKEVERIRDTVDYEFARDLESYEVQLHTQIACIRFEVEGLGGLTEAEKEWATDKGLLRNDEIDPETRNCHFIAIEGTLRSLEEILKMKDR